MAKASVDGLCDRALLGGFDLSEPLDVGSRVRIGVCLMAPFDAPENRLAPTVSRCDVTPRMAGIVPGHRKPAANPALTDPARAAKGRRHLPRRHRKCLRSQIIWAPV